MDNEPTFVIESRIQLSSALAEASEIEHNLMCLYLYAMFSLKRSPEEGVSPHELDTINRWRQVILSVALEEMTHLTLVSNLLSAIGVGPNFMRPNFPTSPGYYPADLIIELAPFNLDTIEHFIYLERPRSQELADGASFEHQQTYTRLSEKGRLMPTSGDYATVSSLYLNIKEAVVQLAGKHGEANFFCGPRDQQIGPLDSALPGLVLITNTQQALAAIDTIIAQGEGAMTLKDSHFQRFCSIRDEYRALLKRNPDFQPARPVARNPLMRKPLNPVRRVWVDDAISAQFMDLANALYTMMLRVLVQIYTIEDRPKKAKAILIEASQTLMHAMATVAETLTFLPASDKQPGVHAGMSFAMVRFLMPLKQITEKRLMVERCGEFLAALSHLKGSLEAWHDVSLMQGCIRQLTATEQNIREVQQQISAMPEVTPRRQDESAAVLSQTPAPISSKPEPEPLGIEVSETEAIRLTYEGKKCIHSRHCVTELPLVFKANTPGKWIFAENTHPEYLATVARACPSGAIQYSRKDGGPEEPVPDVNIMRIRENGPYAFLADLVLDGKKFGKRATLCRCGQSQNKPFCDGAHNTAEFVATGNPQTLDDTPLAVRNGPLEVHRISNGPLSVQGNLEICAGTGRVVLRTASARLCRCGHSQNKPLCDNSHVAVNFEDKVPGNIT